VARPATTSSTAAPAAAIAVSADRAATSGFAAKAPEAKLPLFFPNLVPCGEVFFLLEPENLEEIWLAEMSVSR
jgi:hypothetical protein